MRWGVTLAVKRAVKVAAPSLPAYFTLAKFRLSASVASTAGLGYLAAVEIPTLIDAGAVVFGTLAYAASANALNQVCKRFPVRARLRLCSIM